MAVLNLKSWALALVLAGAVVVALPAGKAKEEEIDLSQLGERIYGEPDVATGEILRYLTPENMTANPEEMGNYAEGDILHLPSDLRNGVRAPAKRWPNGRVPYKLAGFFTEQDKKILAQAMDEYHEKTCIRFVPYAGDRNYIRITSGNTGCWSSVGMVGGEQDVNFQSPGCIYTVGTPIHEFMHALGFMHEQNREDRDEAVSIIWDNVRQGTRDNFVKANPGTTDAMGVPYDYGSVLHYSANAFSTNGQPTIVSKKGHQPDMGQRRGFSQGDIIKINKMYCGGKMPAAAAALSSKPTYNNNAPAAAAPAAGQPNFLEMIWNAFRPKDEENEV